MRDSVWKTDTAFCIGKTHFGIGAYFAVAVYALWLDAAWKFWTMATFVGVFQGAIQALSRSYYARIIPKEKSTEYFGIFDIFGKGASFMGTMLMGITTQLFDTSRAGVAAIAAMFVVGFRCSAGAWRGRRHRAVR